VHQWYARKTDESVYKPDSVLAERGATIYLRHVLPHTFGYNYPCDLPVDEASNSYRRDQLIFLVLLPVGFTKPSHSHEMLVVSYTTVSPLPCVQGGLFSVALARGFSQVGVTHHRALWSPDFPRISPRSPDRLIQGSILPVPGRSGTHFWRSACAEPGYGAVNISAPVWVT